MTENLETLRFFKIFELRPTLTTDLSPLVEEELKKGNVPEQARAIIKNLFCAIRTVAAHVVHLVPICGNIQYQPEREPSPIKHHIDIHDDDSIVDEEIKR